MKLSLISQAALAIATCFCAACSDANASGSANASIDGVAWQSALPPNTSTPTLGDSVQFQGCTYTIGTAQQAPPFPPQFLAIIERSGSDKHCSTAFVVIGSSFATPSVAIAAGHGGLVADFSTKATPSGEAHSSLVIVQIDAKSGDTIRQTVLAAMAPDPFHPQQGNVFDGALEIGPGGDLTVTGSKDGIIPGETGAGLNYIATYDRFLHGPANPAPTSVVAFNAVM